MIVTDSVHDRINTMILVLDTVLASNHRIQLIRDNGSQNMIMHDALKSGNPAVKARNTTFIGREMHFIRDNFFFLLNACDLHQINGN